MKLSDLDCPEELKDYLQAENLSDFEVGRISIEHKERYIIKTTKGEYDAEITGNMRFSARDRDDFPAVGDWVAFQSFDANSAIIHAILPRTNLLERKAIGKLGEKQLIATNIDVAFIVQAVGHDFNINRIERYLSICLTAKIKPVLIISKTDLASAEELHEIIEGLKQRNVHHKVLMMSNLNGEDVAKIKSLITRGYTYCFIGSSGVGKSTLINQLIGNELMQTTEISNSTSKGKHTTSHRELIVLETGGVLIDTPGMRELGMTDDESGVVATFDEISQLAKKCKFSDCTHTTETACAVLDAVDNGEIDQATVDNFLKLQREQEHFSSTVAEKRKKDKEFGKMVKYMKKSKKKEKGR